MKKTHSFKNQFSLFLILMMCLFIFNFSCGLEEYVIIAEPAGTDNQPNTESSFNSKCFEFRTNENLGDDGFKGTEVYYKIYNNYQKMINDISQLESIASDDDKKSNSYSTMISKEYQKLTYRVDGENHGSYLVPAKKGKSYQRVYIRLTDYLDLDEFSAVIKIDDEVAGFPARYQDDLTFNFGNSGINDLVPSSSDKDTSISGTSTGTWYVSMFAVGVGLDTNLTPHYSNILYLGSVSIVENSNMN